MLRIPSNTVEPPPRIGKVERDYIAGVGRFGKMLTSAAENLDRLMTSSEILQCEAAEA